MPSFSPRLNSTPSSVPTMDVGQPSVATVLHLSPAVIIAFVAVLVLAICLAVYFAIRTIRSRRQIDCAEEPNSMGVLKTLRLPHSIADKLQSIPHASDKDQGVILPLHSKISIPVLVSGTGPMAIVNPAIWERPTSPMASTAITNPPCRKAGAPESTGKKSLMTPTGEGSVSVISCIVIMLIVLCTQKQSA